MRPASRIFVLCLLAMTMVLGGAQVALAAAMPQITSFSPASGPAGTVVTISGSWLTTVDAVRFNGLAAASFNALTDAQMTAVVPDGATTGKITVHRTTYSYTNTSVTTFTVTPSVPAITGLTSPSHPDSATVYSDNDPKFGWDFLSGIAGYSYALDANPSAEDLDATREPVALYDPAIAAGNVWPDLAYSTQSMVTGDFGKDGHQDVIAAGVDREIFVFSGNGDGTYDPYVTYTTPPTEGRPRGITSGDFNGDTWTDFAVTLDSQYSKVAVYLNDTAGGFLEPTFYSTDSEYVGELSAGDVDGDGNVDLAVACTTRDNRISVLTGNGDGTFDAAKGYADVPNSRELALADFDEDGKLDIVTLNDSSGWNDLGMGKPGRVGMLLNIGTGVGTDSYPNPLPAAPTSELTSYTASEGWFPAGLAVGDFNNDTHLDIAYGFYGHLDGSLLPGITVMLGDGTGALGTPQVFANNIQVNDLFAADMNGDGVKDLVAATTSGIAILTTSGDGAFASTVPAADLYNGGPDGAVTELDVAGAADFNEDGRADAVGSAIYGLRTVLSADPSVSYTDIGDGIWYFHVRAVGAEDAVGPVSTQKIQIHMPATALEAAPNPDALNAGETSLITFTLTRADGSGDPLEKLTITAPEGGVLSTDTITTDINGEATVSFTAPDPNAECSVRATTADTLLNAVVWFTPPPPPLESRVTETIRASVDAEGEEVGWRYNYAGDLSSDGNWVVFRTRNAFDDADTNGRYDDYLKNLSTGAVQWVTLSSDEVQSNSDSGSSPKVSADGLYVVYNSIARDIVPGDDNGTQDVFYRDVAAGTTTRLSVDAEGNDYARGSRSASISDNGLYVAFVTGAPLALGDTDPGQESGESIDIYVRDMTTGAIERSSVATDGGQANDWSDYPSISNDGRYVTFVSAASNLVEDDTNGCDDIFVYDRTAQTTSRVSLGIGEEEANNDSDYPAISGDGRYVAFESDADNLDYGDYNDCTDAFLFDRETSSTVCLSLNSDGETANSGSSGPSISAQGNAVAFESGADDLVAGDINGEDDIFVRDLTYRTITIASVSTEHAAGDDYSQGPSLSADGLLVGYDSYATNLVADDTNDEGDVFVSTLGPVVPPTTCTLLYRAGYGGSIDVGKGQTGEYSQDVSFGDTGGTVTAVPDSGYRFVQWSDGGLLAERSDIGVMQLKAVTAVFEEDTSGFTVTATPPTNGTITPAGVTPAAAGENITYTVTPDEGYRIGRVTDDGDGIPATDGVYVVRNVTSNRTIAATFVRVYHLSFIAGGNGSIEDSATQVVDTGADASSVAASPTAGHHFVNWTGTGSIETTTANPLTVPSVSEDATFTANFAADEGASLTVVSATATSTTEVDVVFSNPLNPTTIEATDFSINDLSIVGTALQADNVTVRLTGSTQVPGKAYTVTATLGSITDTGGVVLAAPNTAAFTGHAGPWIEKDDPDNVTVDFGSVSTAGTVSATVPGTFRTPPTGFALVQGSYFDITTDTDFSSEDGFTVTVPYDSAKVTNPANLKLFHWEGSPGGWVDITTGVDTNLHTVSGHAHSFSDYAVMEGAGSGSVTSTPASSNWSLAIAVLLAIAAAWALRRKEFRT